MRAPLATSAPLLITQRPCQCRAVNPYDMFYDLARVHCRGLNARMSNMTMERSKEHIRVLVVLVSTKGISTPTLDVFRIDSKSSMKLTFSTITAFVICLASIANGSPTPDNSLLSRDVCGSGYPGYTRRIGSPCAASNGVHQFCSCDRTNIVRIPIKIELQALKGLMLMTRRQSASVAIGSMARTARRVDSSVMPARTVPKLFVSRLSCTVWRTASAIQHVERPRAAAFLY